MPFLIGFENPRLDFSVGAGVGVFCVTFRGGSAASSSRLKQGLKQDFKKRDI